MKKLFKKSFCALLAVVCILSMPATAFAASVPVDTAHTPPQTRASNFISSYSASLSSSSGTVSVSAIVRGTNTMTTIGATRIVLYESSNNGASFTAIKTFSSGVYTAMLKSNSTTYSATPVSYSGVAGRQYYAVVTCYAQNSSGNDSKQYTTNTIIAR